MGLLNSLQEADRRRQAGRGQLAGLSRRGTDVAAGEEADRGQRARHPGQVGQTESEHVAVTQDIEVLGTRSSLGDSL